jgi:uncharacterized protein DUF1905
VEFYHDRLQITLQKDFKAEQELWQYNSLCMHRDFSCMLFSTNVWLGIGWNLSMFPKDSRYIVPIKASVRKAENLQKGDQVMIRLEIH